MTSFAHRITHWQRHSGRHDLPWQGSRDPYPIWLSEIMLQQTQVTTVLGYFPRFMARFPDVRALAAAPLDAVFSLWAGLGYYARAKNLHACAVKVVAEHGGKFPASAAALAELPGIGRSTAAAIAAFAYGERAAILDGNVKRVLCRHFAIEGVPVGAVEKELWTLANALLPASTDMPAYTQGLMDLGATLCAARKPCCLECPLATSCLAWQQGRVQNLPTPRVKTQKPERRSEFLLMTDGKNILLQRRPSTGIWGGLLTPPEGLELLLDFGLSEHKLQTLPPRTHVFTHFRLEIHPRLCRVEQMPLFVSEPGLECLTLEDALQAGVPAPVLRLLREVVALTEK
ncbi:MAG: A/G-specific adenine glycosylase [Zoogloeaceae bacterium]|nr:A/G-specific adenine glycosylase [Zoogloeaceae bacterium]